MNDRLKKVLMYKYNAEVQDALYKIQCYSDHELVHDEKEKAKVNLNPEDFFNGA